jgi:ATP-dependent Clp protease ATP-binding subunit ClpA
MLSEELELTLNRAFKEARDKRHEFMTVEHLLLALSENPTSRSALQACGGNIEELQADLHNFLDETTPLLPEVDDREIEPTLGFQRVLQRAVFQPGPTITCCYL